MASKSEIFSVFGQIEAVIADMMIKEGKATKIDYKDIPESAAVNKQGTKALFAVVMPRKHLHEYAERVVVKFICAT